MNLIRDATASSLPATGRRTTKHWACFLRASLLRKTLGLLRRWLAEFWGMGCECGLRIVQISWQFSGLVSQNLNGIGCKSIKHFSVSLNEIHTCFKGLMHPQLWEAFAEGSCGSITAPLPLWDGYRP